MNIEEQLDKLAERTDAIARNLELLSLIQLDSEKRHAALEESLTERMTVLTERMAVLAEASAQLDSGMTRVANILLIHEQRLDDLQAGNRPR